MRYLAIALLLICLVIPAIAAANGPKSSGDSACAGDAHAHQYGDIRMAVVEVNSIDQCGFSFVDLEENTVGMDNSFQFADDFEVVRIEQKGQQTSAFVKVEIPRKAVKKGMRALAVYCAACKSVFSLKPYGDQHDGILTFSK
jgi:hypothetical protein